MIKKILRRIRRKLHKRIPDGPGAMLWFDSGRSNPEYEIGKNEIPIQDLIARTLSDGDVFYDIGANVGFFTILAARMVGEHGKVYSFEPVEENVFALKRNIRKNSFHNVSVIKSAVSSYGGMGELILAEKSGGAMLADVGRPPDAKGSINVSVTSIDYFLSEKVNIPPSLIKIDVEGAEVDVIRGMKRTLEHFRPLVIIEFDDKDLPELENKEKRCRKIIEDHGYKMQRLVDSYSNLNWYVHHFLAFPRI